MRKFTYDIIRQDSFPIRILIRFSNDNDSESDIFDTLESVRKSVNNNLIMDVFISSEILKELL